MDDDYSTEFERAMRGCRRRMQERLDRAVEVYSIDGNGGIDRETKPMWRTAETNEPVWSDVPADSVGRMDE